MFDAPVGAMGASSLVSSHFAMLGDPWCRAPSVPPQFRSRSPFTFIVGLVRPRFGGGAGRSVNATLMLSARFHFWSGRLASRFGIFECSFPACFSLLELERVRSLPVRDHLGEILFAFAGGLYDSNANDVQCVFVLSSKRGFARGKMVRQPRVRGTSRCPNGLLQDVR